MTTGTNFQRGRHGRAPTRQKDLADSKSNCIFKSLLYIAPLEQTKVSQALRVRRLFSGFLKSRPRRLADEPLSCPSPEQLLNSIVYNSLSLPRILPRILQEHVLCLNPRESKTYLVFDLPGPAWQRPSRAVPHSLAHYGLHSNISHTDLHGRHGTENEGKRLLLPMSSSRWVNLSRYDCNPAHRTSRTRTGAARLVTACRDPVCLPYRLLSVRPSSVCPERHSRSQPEIALRCTPSENAHCHP